MIINCNSDYDYAIETDEGCNDSSYKNDLKGGRYYLRVDVTCPCSEDGCNDATEFSYDESSNPDLQ